MPTLLSSCRSGHNFDSLPRGQRGSNAAIHKLKLQKINQQSLDDTEFGSSSGSSRIPSPGGDERAAGVRLSSSQPTSPAKSGKRVHSNMRPVEHHPTGTGAGGGKGQQGVERTRSSPFPQSAPSSPALGHSHAHSHHGGGPIKARRRAVDKRMIGLPTNFQHTGHIGPSSYAAATSMMDSDAIKAQLSQVAAALNGLSVPADDVQDEPQPASQQAKPYTATADNNQAPMEPTLPPEPAEDEEQHAIRLVNPQVSPEAELASVPSGPSAIVEPHVQAEQPPELMRSTDSQPPSSPPKPKRLPSRRKPAPEVNFAEMLSASPPGPIPSDPIAPISGLSPVLEPASGADPAAQLLAPTVTAEEPSIASQLLAPRYQPPSSGHTSTDSEAEASEAVSGLPTGTIRVNGRAMVEGPSGSLITRTANTRWNSALAEITAALAASGDDENEAESAPKMLTKAEEDALLLRMGIPLGPSTRLNYAPRQPPPSETVRLKTQLADVAHVLDAMSDDGAGADK